MGSERWAFFTIESLFEIETGNDLIMRDLTLGHISVVGHSKENNGVVTNSDKIEHRPIYNANNTIALADRGNFYATVQATDFYIATRVKALISKYPEANKLSLLFIATIINKEEFKFNYGRNATDKIPKIEIKLPVTILGVPDWEFMETEIDRIVKIIDIDNKSKTNNSVSQLQKLNWEEFYIKDIFTTIENCKCQNASELDDGDDIYYIGAKKTDNGAMKRVAINTELRTKGNCIIFICDGQGSVGYSNYIDMDFIGSTTLSVGYMNNLNKYIGLFLVTILDLERSKYSFGRKYRRGLLDTKIKLPSDKQGNPDWQFMEDYIKSLPYSDNL